MKEIRLENFRCFSEMNIAFRSGVNLLVGDNATGKTSVLKACKYALSSFFSGFSDDNTKWLNPGNDDFRQVLSDGFLLPEQPIRIFFDVADMSVLPLPPSLLADGLSFGGSLIKNSKKNSRSQTSGIKEYKEYAASVLKGYLDEKGQHLALPLFAAFSTEDIHATRKIDTKKFKQYMHKPSFGYYECLEGNGFFPYWIKRLLVLQEWREEHPEVVIVRRTIQTALGMDGCGIIRDMDIRPNQGKVYYILTDGREIEAEHLSDGYRRLVNIVTDLAFRCALLNRGFYGEETCEKTQGTVLIDEVDLHLHPSLQAVVLKGLRRAFPKLQFIVSSHAPMVMSGVKTDEKNIVYLLDYLKEDGYTITATRTYGMDMSTLTNVVLKQVPRDANVDEKLKKLFDLIDQEKMDEAKSLLRNMQKHFGDTLPELAQAEAMLDFLD